MEEVVNNKPIDWTFTNPDGVTSVSAQGRVHTGNFAVNIVNGSAISQTVSVSTGGCFYDFSFFARGEESQVGFTATVTFDTTTGPVTGATITVRQQDLSTYNGQFQFFRTTTTQAPINTTAITVTILVDAEGSQSLDLDDVSLTVD